MSRKETGNTSNRQVQWQHLSDETLLELRVRDLGLRVEGTALEPRIQRLYDELDAVGIGYHPPCYLADEWLCPDQTPVIGIPFYLAHPRLMALERRMMLEVEGGTEAWCMKLLRHEAGHAINYAYRFYRRRRWREIFGSFTAPYAVGSYDPQPYSRRYVVHLEDHYAQSHPDEDFAETFAVWLTPGSRWRDRYRGRPALGKLSYVDELMTEFRDRLPVEADREMLWSASRMTSTLGAYYGRKRRYLGREFPGFYDAALKRIFAEHGADPVSASRFLRAQRPQIVASVTRWTGQRRYDVDRLVRKLITRCDALSLHRDRAEETTALDIAAFTTSVINSMRTSHGRARAHETST